MSTIPSYLLLCRHSVYCVRFVVPDIIRPLFLLPINFAEPHYGR